MVEIEVFIKCTHQALPRSVVNLKCKIISQKNKIKLIKKMGDSLFPRQSILRGGKHWIIGLIKLFEICLNF